MNRPRVSICIPTYNNADFIIPTLNSILQQEYSDLEVIIQDDASTDATPKLVRDFIQTNQESRFFLHILPKNQGVEKNWNSCVQRASGEYIKLLCADDLLDPGCLKKQVAILDNPQNQNIAFTAAQRRIIGPQGKLILPKWSLGRNSIQMNRSEVLKKCTFWGTNIIGEPCAVLMRASAWKTTSGFSEKNPYLIDLDLWCKLLLKGDIILLPEVLCSFRVSNQSTTSRLARKQIIQSRQFFQALYRENPQVIPWIYFRLGWIIGTLLGYLRVLLFRLSGER